MFIVLGLAIFLALMTVSGDYLVLMSIRKPEAMVAMLVAAVLLYGLQAFGWRFIFQQVSISTAAVLYSSLTTILLVGLGVLVFKEELSARTLLGVGLAIAAVVVVET